jgi:putative Mn2+ efflux pump MntP
MLINAFKKNKRKEDTETKDDKSENGTQRLGIKTTLLLGLALSLNCIGLSIGAGITGVGSEALAISMTVFSFISILLGNLIGLRRWIHVRMPQKPLEIVSAILIIGIGIYEAFV